LLFKIVGREIQSLDREDAIVISKYLHNADLEHLYSLLPQQKFPLREVKFEGVIPLPTIYYLHKGDACDIESEVKWRYYDADEVTKLLAGAVYYTSRQKVVEGIFPLPSLAVTSYYIIPNEGGPCENYYSRRLEFHRAVGRLKNWDDPNDKFSYTILKMINGVPAPLVPEDRCFYWAFKKVKKDMFDKNCLDDPLRPKN
jgi:hypothetical protein